MHKNAKKLFNIFKLMLNLFVSIGLVLYLVINYDVGAD